MIYAIAIFFAMIPSYAEDDGIPWNREFFPRERLLKQTSVDPALYASYTYSVSFLSSPFGNFSQTSYMAHLGYEFTPDLHLYADIGLWMPLYTHFKYDIPREDLRQGKIDVVVPSVSLEYKPTKNTYLLLSIINDNDYRKVYSPFGEPFCCHRNANFVPR